MSSETGWGILVEVRDGSGTLREVRDGSEEPQRGPVGVVGPSRRSGTGRETLGADREGSGKSGTGRETLGEVTDGLGDP